MKFKALLIFLLLPSSLFCSAFSGAHIFSLDLDYAVTGVMNNGWGLGFYYDQEILPSLSVKGGFGHMTFLDSQFDFTCTTVSVTMALDYYPFGPVFRGGYAGITTGTDFVEYIGEDGRDGEESVISFTPHVGWKIKVSEKIIIDLYSGYKFSPFSGRMRGRTEDYLNMGMQYKLGCKFFL